MVIIEPQAADYWPRIAQLVTPTCSPSHALPICGGAPTTWSWNRRAPARCSRFAIRRLQPRWPCSPRRNKSDSSAGATAFPGVELLALLLDCEILFKIGARQEALRAAEGDEHLVLWDFHDLLFHARSTEGRHANPLGGIVPLFRCDCSATGGAAALARRENRLAQIRSPRGRQATRRMRTSAGTPLDPRFERSRRSRSASLRTFSTALRVSNRASPGSLAASGGPLLAFAPRPYPSAGAARARALSCRRQMRRACARLYHYDAGEHALVAIDVLPQQWKRC